MASAALFGLLLGVRHALEADHIVAVTAMVSEGRGIYRSALVGLRWGLGHSITLFAVGFAALVLRINVPDRVSLSLEFAVGVAMVVLGVPLVARLVRRRHLHRHQHEDDWHAHQHSHAEAESHAHQHAKRPLFMGMLHGLAGSGTLTILVLSTMESIPEGLLFLGLFGAGSIVAMLVVSGLLGLSFGLAARSPGRLDWWLEGVVGLGSIAFGLFIMWRVVDAGALFTASTWG